VAVPFIDLKRFEEGFLDSWNSKVAELSRETRFIGGPEVTAFEKILSEDTGVKHAIGCANGTDALQLALRAAGVGKDDTVIVPDATFWATFEAVVNVGADPVTVDIHPDDLQLDFDLFKQAVERYRPKAAMIVHLYGWSSARLQEFRSYCRENGIALIEDGAQSYGVRYGSDSIYKNAFISTISFYPAKVFGAAGDAGAVLTNDDSIAEKIRSLGNHGREAHYAHGSVGWNSRLSTLQAAYLTLSFAHLEKRLESRRKTAERYRSRLPKMGIRCVHPPADYIENGYLNVTLHEPELRERLKTILTEQKIGFGIVYPGAVSEQKGAQGFLKGAVGGESARRLSSTVLNLPLFPYMTDAEFDEVMEAVSLLK
jgi:dTDP-4-amino-4,6-dideoxygalactose transaminase